MTRLSETGSLGVVVPAAGSGARLGGRPKAFLAVADVPLLRHSLGPFLDDPAVRIIVVALPEADAGDPPAWLRSLAPRVRVVSGGDTRTLSVHRALRAIEGGVDVVLVHDAARPLVTPDIIDRCVAAARRGVGAVAGWPVSDTIKRAGAGGGVLETPDRKELWAAQTPQAFPASALLEAYDRAAAAGLEATDDAEIYERFGGGRVEMVEGSRWNLKVTYPEDLEVAAMLIRRRGEANDGDAGARSDAEG